MQKPPHTITIELTPEQVEQGAREHKYAEYMRAYRSGEMSDERWEELQDDDDFQDWRMGL